MRVLYVATDLRDADILQQEARRATPDLTFDICAGLAALRARPDPLSAHDVLVMDAGLPEAEQLQLIHYVRVRQLALPIVVLAAATGGIPSAALSAGADDFIVRGPKAGERLASTLRMATERYRTFAGAMRDNEKLKRSEARLRLIIEALPVGVLLLDQAGKVLAMNAAGVHDFGFVSPQDVVGRPFATLIPVEDHPALHQFLEKVGAGEEASMHFSSLADEERPQVFNLRGLCIQRDQHGQTAVLGVMERVPVAPSAQHTWSADIDFSATGLPAPLLDPDGGVDGLPVPDLAPAQTRVEELEARSREAESQVAALQAEVASLQAALSQAEDEKRSMMARLEESDARAATVTVDRDGLLRALTQAEADQRAAGERASRAEAQHREAVEHAAQVEAWQRAAADRASQAEAQQRAVQERAAQAESQQRAAEEQAARFEALQRLAEERAATVEAEHSAISERLTQLDADHRAAAERADAADAQARANAERAAQADILQRAAEEKSAIAEDRAAAAEARAAAAEAHAHASAERATHADAQRQAAEERAAAAEARHRAAIEQLAQAESRVRELESALEAQTRLAEEHAQQGHERSALASSLDALRAELAATVDQLATAQRLEEDLRVQLASHQAMLGERDAALAEQQARLSDQEAALRGHASQIGEKDALLAAREAELSSRAAQLADFAATAATLDETRAALGRARAELEASRAELASLAQTISVQREDNERLQATLARQEAEAIDAERQAQGRIADLEREQRALSERLRDLLEQQPRDASAAPARGFAADPARRGSERLGRLAAAMAGDLHASVATAADAAKALSSASASAAGTPNGELDGAAIRDSAARALEAILRCGELARHLLRLSTRYVNQNARVDLGRLVRQQEALLRHLAGPDIELHCDLTPGLVLSDFDSQDLTHVLTSLVGAARDALPLGGVIRVATSAQPVESDSARGERPRPLVLSVSAKGYGIRPVPSTTCEEVTERCGGLLTTVIEPNVSWTLRAALPGGLASDADAEAGAPADLTRSA